jgi:DNA-binding CsgD family transcriptional regulator
MPTWQRPEPPARWLRMTQPAFVGRRTQFDALEEAWAGVTEGVRHAVFVGAEAGGGKTRFVVEAALALHAERAGLVWGACSPDMGMAHDPFVEPVAALLGAMLADDGVPAVPEATLDRLRTLTASRGWEGSVADDLFRSELYRAVVEALAWAASVRPVVLVLEDLHWAGQAGRDLLKYVVSRTDDQRLLVLATMRSTPPDRSSQLSETISELYRLEGVQRLDLPSLDVGEITTYLERNRLLAGDEARHAAAVMRDTTGGNPFLLRETCRRLDPHESRWTFSAPGSYAASIALRLDSLEPTPRAVLRVAAVMGEEVDIAELSHAASRFIGEEVSRERLVEILAAAKSLGLLDTAHAETTSAHFPHALARQAMLETLSDVDLLHSHAAIALTLEAEHPAAVRRTVRLAAHFAEAAVLGYEREATRHLTEAGDQARGSSAHAEAADYYERAAALASDPLERDSLILQAARSALLGWQLDRARELDERASSSQDPELRLRAGIGHAAAVWRDGVSARRSLHLLTAALASCPDVPPELHVHATASLARLNAWTGERQTGMRLAADAIARARELGDPDLLARVMSIAMSDGSGFDELDRTIERAEELMRMGPGSRGAYALGPACYHRCEAYYIKGDSAALAVATRDLQAMADLTAQPFWSWVAGAVSFGTAVARGELDRAEQSLEVARRRLRLTEGATPSGADGIMAFALRRETGLPAAARRLLHEPGDPDVWPPAGLALATELRERGVCQRWLDDILRRSLADLQASASWPAVLSYLVDAAAWLEDVSAAEALLPMVTPYAGHNLLGAEFLHPVGSADLPVAELLSLLGRPEAPRHFEQALVMNRRMGAHLHEATALARYARHAALHPTPGVSVSALSTQARSLAERSGMARVLRELDELAGLGRPDWGLTGREQEVLGLLGRGLSNRQIAEVLVISEHTAANHVRSILMKTGSTNRTQAALLASSADQSETLTREPSGRTR